MTHNFPTCRFVLRPMLNTASVTFPRLSPRIALLVLLVLSLLPSSYAAFIVGKPVPESEVTLPVLPRPDDRFRLIFNSSASRSSSCSAFAEVQHKFTATEVARRDWRSSLARSRCGKRKREWDIRASQTVRLKAAGWSTTDNTLRQHKAASVYDALPTGDVVKNPRQAF